jgi:hypothetical protein
MYYKKYLLSLLLTTAVLGSQAQFHVPTGERIFVTAADELHVQENLENSGTIDRITLSGSAAHSISGTGSIFHLKVNKTTNPATISSGRQSIISTLDLTAGTLDAGAGLLRLKSLSTGTAQVLRHTGVGTGNIIGTVQVERYMASGKKQQWRLLGFPYSTSVQISSLQGMGMEFSPGVQTIMYFKESDDNAVYGNGGTRNNGYKTYTSTLDYITAGTGVAAWVFAPTGTTAQSGGNLTDSVTLVSSGTLQEDGSAVVYNLSFSSELPDGKRGWNLVANPFASPVNWTGVTRNNIGGTIYRWDPIATDWTTHNGTDGTGSATDAIIESGTSFFVIASAASPMLTFPQTAKTTSNAIFTHLSKAPFRLDIPGERIPAAVKGLGIRVAARGPGNPFPSDVYVDLSKSDASPAFDPAYDAVSMGRTSGVGLSIAGTGDRQYAMQYDRPITSTGSEKRYYPINISSPAKGVVNMTLKTEGAWNPLNSVALIDKKEGKTLLMKGGQLTHGFTLDELKSEGRFILAINHVKLSADGQSPAFEVKALGNPVTTSVIDLLVTHPTASAKRWRVVDAMGRETGMGVFASDAGIQHRLTVPGMRNPGAYVVQVEMDNGETQHVRILKN